MESILTGSIFFRGAFCFGEHFEGSILFRGAFFGEHFTGSIWRGAFVWRAFDPESSAAFDTCWREEEAAEAGNSSHYEILVSGAFRDITYLLLDYSYLMSDFV